MTDACTIERYLNRPDWLAGTHQSVGASSSARIVGLSGYGSPYSEWVRFTEPLRIDEPDEMQRWGLLLEPVIFDELNRLAGGPDRDKFAMLKPFTVYRDPDRPYVHATLDGMTDDGEPVEAKTAHFAQAKIWGKEVPLPYMVQVQHQIHAARAKCGYIAVLKDGYEFAWHRVPRHQKFIDRLLKRIDYFWAHYVLTREPPPTDFSEATSDALARKYPTSNGSVVPLPDDCEPLYDEMKTLTATETAASKRKDWIKNYVRQQIGEHRYGYLPSGKGFQWSGDSGKRRFTQIERCPEPAASNA